MVKSKIQQENVERRLRKNAKERERYNSNKDLTEQHDDILFPLAGQEFRNEVLKELKQKLKRNE